MTNVIKLGGYCYRIAPLSDGEWRQVVSALASSSAVADLLARPRHEQNVDAVTRTMLDSPAAYAVAAVVFLRHCERWSEGAAPEPMVRAHLSQMHPRDLAAWLHWCIRNSLGNISAAVEGLARAGAVGDA